MVRHYDIERTLCDYVRTERRFFLKEEDVFNPIRLCFASVEIDIQKLADYAELFGIKEKLKKYLLDVTENSGSLSLSYESGKLFIDNRHKILLL